ncbi:MAG: arylesterase [Pseudomonadota bacterium]
MPSCSETPTLNYISEDETILAFGDSLTVGVGASDESNYPSTLERLANRNVVNAGISGETTREGLDRLPGVMDDVNPKLVILLEGGNDILRNKSLDQTKQNLAEMINIIQSHGAEVILIGVPEKKLFSSVAPFYTELAQEYNLVFIDELLSDMLRDNQYKSDPIHLNAKGYQKLAEEIHERLAKSGAL